MAEKLFLELASPERLLISKEVDEIYAPGSEGDMGILPGHAAMLAILRTGEFSYRIGEHTEYVALDGGFLEVFSDKVVVLADGAELGSEINLDEMLRKEMEVSEGLEEAKRKGDIDLAVMEAELKRSVVRIGIASHYK